MGVNNLGVKHRPELDGVRGIAILIVLLAHARAPGFAVDGGVAGVTLFFVLSGYLITGILAREINETGHANLARFYARRALRLLPALLVVLVVSTIAYELDVWGPPPATLPLTIVAVLAYMGNWAGIAGLQLGVLAHTWSLAIEEQFYLVWPLVLIAGLRFRWFGLVLLVAAVLVTPYRFTMGDGSHIFAGTDAHVDGLLIGSAIALLGSRLPSWAGWAGIVAIVVLGVTWQTTGGLVWFLPMATVASALIVAGVPAALGWAPLAYVGKISYGLYLWHYLFIWSGLAWPVVVVVSLVVASLSYRYLEAPFLRLKDRMPGARILRSEPEAVAA